MLRSRLTLTALALAATTALGAWGCSTAPCTDHEAEPVKLTGDYVGQTPPGAEPQLFAPGFISTGLYERDVAMTADGNEFYFGLLSRSYATIVVTKRVNGEWTPPELASFSTDPDFRDLEAHITPDGGRLLFLSTRPRPKREYKPGWENQDIWAVDRTPDDWARPYNLGLPVSSDAPEYFPSVTRDGTIYFTREVTEGEKKRSLIFRARLVGGSYGDPEVLPEAVNPGDQQYNAFIHPDETYLILGIGGREDAIGRSDYYVSFRAEDDTWSGPINMGEAINTADNAVTSPYISPDGKYFFFASTRKQSAGEAEAGQRSYEEIQETQTRPGNGNSDIYWVDASFIEALRPAR
jgi:hypothetical protein